MRDVFDLQREWVWSIERNMRHLCNFNKVPMACCSVLRAVIARWGIPALHPSRSCLYLPTHGETAAVWLPEQRISTVPPFITLHCSVILKHTQFTRCKDTSRNSLFSCADWHCLNRKGKCVALNALWDITLTHASNFNIKSCPIWLEVVISSFKIIPYWAKV